MKPLFFSKPAELRKWLRDNHATAKELWVGFHKKKSGRPSVTWPEAVDEALCFGWVDGVRKRLNESSYVIRFTPRRVISIWSAINIRRAEALTSEGKMRPAGAKAFVARRENRSGIYSYEQRSTQLPPAYTRLLRRNDRAWQFFVRQPPSYRKMVVWWITSAKKDETRKKRMEKLTAACEQQKRL